MSIMKTNGKWMPGTAPGGSQGYVWIICGRPLTAAVVIVNATRTEVKASVLYEDKPAPVSMVFAVPNSSLYLLDTIEQAKDWCYTVARLDDLV